MTTVIAAADIGYGSVKAMLQGKPPIHFASGAAPADKMPTLMNGTRDKPLKVGGADWYAGFEQDMTTHRRHSAGRFALSPDYHALFLETLHRLGKSSIDVLVLGLPSREFESDVKDALKKACAGDHDVRGRKVTVSKVLVADQPLGTAALYFDANQKRLERARLLTVDIGYGTTDQAVVVRGAVDRSLSMSLESAMGTVCAMAARELSNASRRVTAALIDEHLRAGEKVMIIRGDDIDIAKAIAPHAEIVAGSIVQGVLGGLGTFSDLTEMVVTGGGALALGGHIKKLTNGLPVTVMRDAVTANLRGFIAMGAAHG